MKELDLLKKDWQKTQSQFKEVSENEIYSMIHKKSSSVVKWILIVSIIEFVVLNGIGLFLSDDFTKKFTELHPYLNIFEKVNYLIVLGFIYLFYRNYKSISVVDSSKKLIEAILNTRKIVNIYIIWNIAIGSFFGVFGAIDGFTAAYSKNNSLKAHIEPVTMAISVAVSLLIIIPIIWVFYKLVYGWLLRNLSKNYEELKKINLEN